MKKEALIPRSRYIQVCVARILRETKSKTLTCKPVTVEACKAAEEALKDEKVDKNE
jgi:hypothetical protein